MTHIDPSVKWGKYKTRKEKKIGTKKKKKLRKVKKGKMAIFGTKTGSEGVSMREEKRERERKKGENGLFTSLKDLWKLSCQFSSEREEKLIHASQATCGYQNLGVSSNSTR